MAFKLKTRKKLLKEYTEKYSNTITDDIYLLNEYFESNNIKNPEKVLSKAEKRLIKILEEREETTIKITLYEYPMHTHRGRKSFMGGIFSPGAKDNKVYFHNEVKKTVNKALGIIHTPCSIIMDAYMEMPEGVPPEEVILYQAKVLQVIAKPDYDNIGKCYSDMMTEMIYIDDDQVHSGQINKYYNLMPRVEIFITFINKHESKYVYKKMKSRKIVQKLLSEDRLVIEYLE